VSTRLTSSGRADHRNQHLRRESLQARALGLAEEVQRLNSRGVKIAREARESASREVLIAGSIGPLGLGVQSRHPAPKRFRIFFTNRRSRSKSAARTSTSSKRFPISKNCSSLSIAIRSFSGLPIVAQLTYAEEGTTYGDVRPAEAAAQLKNKNVQVIGANCTLGPQALLRILQELAAVDDLRVSGMPNAGFPKREGDRIVYPKSSPEYFALFAREAARTRRAHSRRMLRHDAGAYPRHGRSSEIASPREIHPAAHSVETVLRPAPAAHREPESKFWKKLQKKEFTVCVEIDPPKGLSLDRIFEQVDKVMASKKWTPSTSIAEPWPALHGRLDCGRRAGSPRHRTVPHLTTRDQNIMPRSSRRSKLPRPSREGG